MDSAPIEAPRPVLSSLENKFSQLSVTVSSDDASLSLAGVNTEPLPAYTPSETLTPAPSSTMPKAQQQPEPQSRGRSPGPRSLASRGLLRHRNTSRNKSKSGHQPQTAALVVQLKRRLRQHQRQQAGTDSDDMEMDVDERRGRTSRRSSVRTGVLAARKRREIGDAAEEGDGDVSGIEVGTSRAAATPYERNNSALVCWSRRRASSFGERPRWMSLPETNPPASAPTDQSTFPPPTSSPVRRKRSGRSASTSGLPILDTTDLTVRRPSFAMSLIMTPLIQDVDMASPMAITPILRTSTESSMWAPRKLQLGVTHGPIDDEPSTSTSTAKTSAAAPPISPPPTYDSVIRPIIEDNDGDADDERTPLRTAPSAPLITVRDASPPAPSSGSGASKGSTSLATVTEEEEGDVEGDCEPKPANEGARVVTLNQDQDAMVL